MADFNLALEHVLRNEGGYVFDKDDPGGETYKGIARNINGTWDGWITIDLLKKQSGFPGNLDTNTALQDTIKTFYKNNYWDRIKGDDLNEQLKANSIFDFAVNAGVSTSATLAQIVAGATPDGVIGPESVGMINALDNEHFLASFTVAKISRYIGIIKKRPSSQKYLYGWISRALGDNI
jgi:lysozyme family protein